jgi:O-antigen ligase
MLATLLNITITIVFYQFLEKKEKKDIVLVILMFFVAVLTFSKSVLLISLNIVLLSCWFHTKKHLKYLNFFFIASAFVILNIATHYLPVPKNFIDLAAFKAQYISDKIVFSTTQSDIYETCYAATKRESIRVFTQNPLFGVGTGNFDTHLEALQKQGFYSPTLPIYNPHCTYIGALAENGIVGFTFLSLFLWMLYKMAKREIFEENFNYTLYLIFISILLEACVTDTMNFRQLWLFFAILVAYHFCTNQDTEQQPLGV